MLFKPFFALSKAWEDAGLRTLGIGLLVHKKPKSAKNHLSS